MLFLAKTRWCNNVILTFEFYQNFNTWRIFSCVSGACHSFLRIIMPRQYSIYKKSIGAQLSQFWAIYRYRIRSIRQSQGKATTNYSSNLGCVWFKSGFSFCIATNINWMENFFWKNLFRYLYTHYFSMFKNACLWKRKNEVQNRNF